MVRQRRSFPLKNQMLCVPPMWPMMAVLTCAIVASASPGFTQSPDDPHLTELYQQLDESEIQALDLEGANFAKKVFGIFYASAFEPIQIQMETYVRTVCPLNPDIEIYVWRAVSNGENEYARFTVSDDRLQANAPCDPKSYSRTELSEAEFARMEGTINGSQYEFNLETFRGENASDYARFLVQVSSNSEGDLIAFSVVKRKRNTNPITRFIAQLEGRGDGEWSSRAVFSYSFVEGRVIYDEDL